MKLIVQPVSTPAPDQVLLPILFTDLAPEQAAKIGNRSVPLAPSLRRRVAPLPDFSRFYLA